MRNPPTTRHIPGSAPGCTLFVKLWQFEPADRTEVRIDTGPDAVGHVAGARYEDRGSLQLFRDAREAVRLERWKAGAEIALTLPGGGEFSCSPAGSRRAARASRRSRGCGLPARRDAEGGCRPRGVQAVGQDRSPRRADHGAGLKERSAVPSPAWLDQVPPPA